MPKLMQKILSWCPLYKMAMGGYWYYRHVQERRYDLSQFCRCGRDVEIGEGVVIRFPERMKIGDGVYIAEDCSIDATGGFQIGNSSGLAQNTTVLTIDHQAGEESVPFGNTRTVKPVVIEDCVWVGKNVSILPGVTIGEGAIIGLGAVVRQNVPPCAIVMGNTARIVGYRDKEHYFARKNSGALRPVSLRCTRLWIPPEMKQKYHGLLKEIGYDVDTGREYFEFRAKA